MREVLPGQPNLLDLIEEAKQAAPAPTLYGSLARGLAARADEFQGWRAEHGGFDSLSRSHAWTVWPSCPHTPTGRCQPTVLAADLRCDCGRDRHGDKPCLCLGDLLFRGACRGCDLEGEPRADENPAAEKTRAITPGRAGGLCP
jgi:Family of unknown function (DUF6349)